jgi:hypothetical protein
LVFDPQSNIFLMFENSCLGFALINATDRGAKLTLRASPMRRAILLEIDRLREASKRLAS